MPENLSIILSGTLLQNPQSHHQKVGCRHKTPVFHNLECEKQGVCAYIPPFGAGIEDFVIIVPEVLLRGTQAR